MLQNMANRAQRLHRIIHLVVGLLEVVCNTAFEALACYKFSLQQDAILFLIILLLFIAVFFEEFFVADGGCVQQIFLHLSGV